MSLSPEVLTALKAASARFQRMEAEQLKEELHQPSVQELSVTLLELWRDSARAVQLLEGGTVTAVLQVRRQPELVRNETWTNWTNIAFELKDDFEDHSLVSDPHDYHHIIMAPSTSRAFSYYTAA